MSAAGLEIAPLRDWIGREERSADTVTVELVRRLRATLDQEPGTPQPGEAAPAAVHWCLAPLVAPMAALGPDGHPVRGGFLPPVPLPRRMWAGGELAFSDRLRVGDAVERRSRIADIRAKEGRTGTLCFVTVEHEVSTGRGLALAERQDIVFRGAAADGAAAPDRAAPPPADTPRPEWRRVMRSDPVLLFRYSALTFNSHRIHYDRRYCLEEEGYAGLVVHGPLQATLLVEFAAGVRGALPARFGFRAVRPLIEGGEFSLNAARREAGLALWIADHDGATTMAAEASW
jgi:3-methylfumaryl-CoA hydratase